MVDKTLEEFFSLLGLSPKEIEICSILATSRELSVLQISQAVGLPRTSVYRLLSKLTSTGLINEIIDRYKTIYSLASVPKIEQLTNNKLNESTRLIHLFPDISNKLFAYAHQATGLNKILYFRGQESVARMTWGALQTKDVFRGYSSRIFGELMGKKETELFRQAWNKSHIQAKDIYSDEYIKSLKEKPELDTDTWQNWQSRYLPSSTLNIKETIDIYNDIIAIYNWQGGEIYGMQIINQSLADFHKQLFDLTWTQAKPLP